METKGFFPFEIITNVLVISFRFFWIPMLLLVSGHCKHLLSFSAGIDFRRQNLTSMDVRFLRLKSTLEKVRAVAFILFYYKVKPQLLGMKWVFEQ